MAFLSYTYFIGIKWRRSYGVYSGHRCKNILEKHSCSNNIECHFIGLSFKKCKWLLCGTYHPPFKDDEYCFNYLDKALDTYSNYEKVLFVGDFNTEITEHYIESFLYEHELSNLVKEKTCFNNM